MIDGKVHGPGGGVELMGINPSTLRNRMDKLGIHYGRGKERERVKEIVANVEYLVLLKLNWRRTIFY